jgi:hypothetical protein
MARNKTTRLSYELEDDVWEDDVKLVVLHTMLALYNVGYREINLGGLMRIMGFAQTEAKDYDYTLIPLDDEFEHYVQTVTQRIAFESDSVPKDATWH